MASKVQKFFGQKINWQESYTSLILGAIIVIILGLLVANFFSKRNQLDQGQIGTAEQTQVKQEDASPSAGSDYTIKANDSLSKISEAAYGSQDHWMAIASANNIATPNIINAGDKLKLPAKADLEKKETALSPPTVQTTYEVAEGDTFFTIAVKMYGDGSKWATLFAANGSRRLPNGNPLVYSGTTIRIPR